VAQSPEYKLPSAGKADGWFCSNAIDQTAAIVEGCIGALNIKGQFCQGDYMVDLKDGGAYQIRNLG